MKEQSERKQLKVVEEQNRKIMKENEELKMKLNAFMKNLNDVKEIIIPTDNLSVLGNAFINSHFNYAPLIWMFCRKTSYNKIEKIHHKTLKVIYKSDDLYDDLLLRNNEVSIHQRHLRFLATEVFKSVNGLNPDFMSDYFTKKIMPYNLRRGEVLCLPKANSSYYGIHGFHFRGSILWNNLPSQIKSSRTVNEFKRSLKALGNIPCLCLICRT